MDKASEQYRAECEARYWLKSIGKSKDKFDATIARVRKIRGLAASEKLAHDIRAEYRKAKSRKKRMKP